MASPPLVLLTGAAGQVGTILRDHWADGRYCLRLADLPAPTQPEGGRLRTNLAQTLRPHEELAEFDCSDYGQFRTACEGVHTVIHLAADPSPSAEFFSSLLERNIIGAYNAFEAAAAAGCRRIVYASSINAIRGYTDTPPEWMGDVAVGARRELGIDARPEPGVHWDDPVMPPNLYGATKCWGEALGRVYSISRALSCLCVRLGHPGLDMVNLTASTFDVNGGSISPRDCAQLFGRCVDVADLPYAIIHGSSEHLDPMMDIQHTKRILGYAPQDGTAFAPPEARPKL
jgi:NAD+ dependent glucose-6-phosphate dehydrogenase